MKNLAVPISIIITGLIIAGAIVYTQRPKSGELPEKEKVTQETGSKEEELTHQEITVTEKDHLRGNPQAPVTIVEFSDFQCPFCSRFHPTVQQALKDLPEKVRWVYKHFPLDQIHPQARPAAEAAECVGEQKGNEGFWRFADLLFENQSRLSQSLYQELAGKLGLNLKQFNNCFSSRKYKDKVEANYQEGLKAGVRGTPGSFVNGEPIPGAVPYETLKAAIEKALANLSK